MALDDLRVGALARAVRLRLGWTQADVAARAHVSQRAVSRVETGQLDAMTVASIRRIAAALEIRMPFAAQWRGGDGVRLLDADHAALVNDVVAVLAAAGWETVVEYSFSQYGERGSVDVVAWHPAGALLLVEVKSRLIDTQETIATLGRKARLVPRLIERDRGWAARMVGVVLVLDDLTANRTAVAQHQATFASAYPARGRVIRTWLRRPTGNLTGIWFLSRSLAATGTRRRGSRKRVRKPRPRSTERSPVAYQPPRG